MINKLPLLPFLIISGSLYIACQAAIVSILHPLGVFSVLRLQLAFSPGTFNDILNTWGSTGIGLYREHFYFDFLLPPLYGSFLFLLLVYIKSRLHNIKKIVFIDFFPFIAALLDLIENIIELTILNNNLTNSANLVFIASSVSLLKWLIVISIVIRLVSLLVRRKVKNETA